MEKINNISFTGVKNIGSVTFKRSKETISKSLSFVLTDDYNGKDLEEFKKIISRMTKKASEYRNPEYPDVVNVECLIADDKKGVMLLNGTPLTTEQKDLDMFSFLAKLIDRIKAMRKKDLVINKTYKELAAPETLIHGINIVPEKNAPKNFIDQFFEFDKIQEGATFVGEFIKKTMYDFLDIEYR